MRATPKRILIVGGVAGGASCAARARRLCETAEIVIFDRGPHVSFANCGLPYYVGDVIKDEEDLLVATPELFRRRFKIDVRLHTEVIAIDRETRSITVRDRQKGADYREAYDVLVLSPGAEPIRPPLPGIDLPGIFFLRTIPDSRQIRAWIEKYQARSAAVIGGGYIGMEITENLIQRGLKVAVIEKQAQVMPLLDAEMLPDVHENLLAHGVNLLLNTSVGAIVNGDGHQLRLQLSSGATLDTDLVIMCIGVRPAAALARQAGLAIGPSGGIQVNEQMRTSDPHIWAVGDAVEVIDSGTGRPSVIPLAGPANRQGRIAADVIMGRAGRFRGVQGTSVVGILDQVVAFTGPSEKQLRRLDLWRDMEKIYLHPGHHASYYPGANPITFKLIFNRSDGRVVGAQAVGKSGVEKRIDVIAMAIQKDATVFDLEEAELCYAPQFGSAKDPVNVAGMIAANILRGDVDIMHWEQLEGSDALLLDVRDPEEYIQDHVDGALNMPLNEIRDRLDELPRNRTILPYCYVGQRSYFAARALTQLGFDVKNLSGGFKNFLLLEAAKDEF